jgi:hypothetical protein
MKSEAERVTAGGVSGEFYSTGVCVGAEYGPDTNQ